MRTCAPARENFHVHVLDQTTPSNVPNTAMLTGTARTSVGTKLCQKTRPPDSAYILRAVRHDEPKPIPVLMLVIMPACKRVLRTSKGNVAIQPMIPLLHRRGVAPKDGAKLCRLELSLDGHGLDVQARRGVVCLRTGSFYMGSRSLGR